MLNFILTMGPQQEFFFLIALAVILLVIGGLGGLPSSLPRWKLPIALIVGAVGVLIPTGIGGALLALYVFWAIFSAATYDLCPKCFDRIRNLIRKKHQE
jgi:hypothetical protein